MARRRPRRFRESTPPTPRAEVAPAPELHASYDLPEPRFEPAHRRLVIASGNALPTGRILFRGERAMFSDEGQYGAALEREIHGTVVVSASRGALTAELRRPRRDGSLRRTYNRAPGKEPLPRSGGGAS